MAGLWNAEYTLMQRYGATRIYGRTVDQKHGGAEIYLLFSWMIFVSIWAARDPATQSRVAALGMAGANRPAFELLTGFGSVAELILPFALGMVILTTSKRLLEERRRARSRAKHRYLVSTAA